MATGSSEALDARVLDLIKRGNLGIRELLRYVLGTDPNNVLQRLMARGSVQSVQGMLPQNRSIYLPKNAKAPGPQALAKRLALAWFTGVDGEHLRSQLHSSEVLNMLPCISPKGAYVLQQDSSSGRLRVLEVFFSQAQSLEDGLGRTLARIESEGDSPLAPHIERGDYGLAVLLPWTWQRVEHVRDLLKEHSVSFELALVPTPETLTLALSERDAA